MVEKILNFSIEKFDFVEENPNSQFAVAKVQAFASDRNEHDMTCSEEVLRKTASSIFDKPVLYNVSSMLNDFASHTTPEKTLIAGFTVPDSAEFIRLPDQRLGLSVLVKLWKRYAPKVMEILKREGETKISVEMELKDSQTLPNGLLDMKDFEYSGICLLGQNVQEASPGAMLQMLSFSNEKKEFDDALRQEFSDKYGEVDLSVLAEIKSNCQMGLDLAKQHNKGSSSVSLALARHMLKSDKASPEKIRHMAKVHKSNKFMDMQKDPPSENYISYMLYGGDHGKKWSVELSEKLDQIDKKHLSYFEKESFGDNDPKKEELSVEDEKEKVEEMAVEETPKEEEKETPEEEKKEDKEEQKKEEEKGTEKKMSLDSNVDLAFLLKLLEDETEDRKSYLGEQFSKPDEEKDMFALFNAMYAKMCKMSAEREEMCNRMATMAADVEKAKSDNDSYMAENKTLKEFKAEVEMARFSAKVESVLADVVDTMPKDELDKAREDSKNFTMETVTAWENGVKAVAFTFSKGKKKDDGIVRIGLPFANTNFKQNDSPWSGNR